MYEADKTQTVIALITKLESDSSVFTLVAPPPLLIVTSVFLIRWCRQEHGTRNGEGMDGTEE